MAYKVNLQQAKAKAIKVAVVQCSWEAFVELHFHLHT